MTSRISIFANSLLSVLLLASMALAQDQGAAGQDAAPKGSEFGIHMGPLLPNQIDGMTEIQPMWGPRYGMPMGTGMAEFSFANSRANGVTYYNAFASYRYDVTLDDLRGILYAGIDLHQWSDSTDTTQTVGGGHLGGGILYPIGNSMWFRSEMKFNLNPGTALYIGFGFVFRLGAGDGAADAGAGG